MLAIMYFITVYAFKVTRVLLQNYVEFQGALCDLRQFPTQAIKMYKPYGFRINVFLIV